MSIAARIGRGVGAFFVVALAWAVFTFGYAEAGPGTHGGAEGRRRLAQPSVYWVVMAAAAVFAGAAGAVLGSRWPLRWIAMGLLSFGS